MDSVLDAHKGLITSTWLGSGLSGRHHVTLDKPLHAARMGHLWAWFLEMVLAFSCLHIYWVSL